MSRDDHSTRKRYAWLARWLLEAPSRWLGRRSGVGQDITGGADGLSYLRHLARGNRIKRKAFFVDEVKIRAAVYQDFEERFLAMAAVLHFCDLLR